MVHPHRLGYHYPDAYPKQALSDYLLTCGEFWSQIASFPIPDERVIAMEYPYLDARIARCGTILQRDQLVFIPQGTMGEPFSQSAVSHGVNRKVMSAASHVAMKHVDAGTTSSKRSRPTCSAPST